MSISWDLRCLDVPLLELNNSKGCYRSGGAWEDVEWEEFGGEGMKVFV